MALPEVETRTLMRATRATAALAGVWFAVGMTLLDRWDRSHSQDIRVNRLLDAIGLVAFLFVPAMLFVVGPKIVPFGFRTRLTAEFWRTYPETIRRVVCWFLGFCAVLLMLYAWRSSTT